ncbi:MAG TPA: hypothetical protein VGP26_24310 [Actinophytocola sp.]|jgi:hypothetical protein|nr:hypothetical protein [Actinophytocola sp.]
MLSDWWNGVELWMLGLPFPLQFALVVVVLVPLCLVVAWAIDRLVDHASAFFGPGRHPEPPIDAVVSLEESATGEQPAAEEPEVAEAAEVVAAAEPAEPAGPERVPAESSGR